ncbi:PLC-like phosphodiesterase [Triangularia verruculosa]|uniref:glycerophosphodiester phosphodiesterase n=1 Tax=Triangularia verruculosa TaxID=2587418 RepID=A0AAN7AY46_9PEZI|nr:PLC-like phosphodiesterase [Triangularia verruculosa]
MATFQKLAILCLGASTVLAAPGDRHHGKKTPKVSPIKQISLGPRPYWLVDQMDEGHLKNKLASCSEKRMKPSDWSISHRGGGTLQFPEHTYESIIAGTRMGAGIQECDVTFTKDLQLVCRHAQCDLHTTTNVVAIPELNAKCTTPFQPASGNKPAQAKCCTSDFTLAEIKTLCAKMDASNPQATTPQEYLGGTPGWRTDLYAKTCSEVPTLREFISWVDDLGLKFTPELKAPEVPMPFNGGNYTREAYAQHMIDEFKAAGIKPERVWPQSFVYEDVLYWLKAEPKWAKQAVLLDESGDTPGTFPSAVARLKEYKKAGVKIVAPPLPYLVTVDSRGKIVPSSYAIEAKKQKLDIVTWSLERSGWLGDGSGGGYYFSTIANVTNGEGDVYNLLHVLAQDVGVIGVFSDWSATVTYYANCFGL